ncbi:MAG: hypothetical protein M1812_002835 [Candelaria pacifica]|nr:MAG: hypothetical protein M1812_002835 [Candelaria pacifica]
MAAKTEGPTPNDKYHDLILRCGTEVMRVHRVVVCGGSPVLDKLLDSSVYEGYKSVIELHEEDPDILNRAITFLYTDDYDTADLNTSSINNGEHNLTSISDVEDHQIAKASESKSTALEIHVAMHAFGYAFRIPRLQTLASKKFYDAVRDGNAWATEGLPMLITKIYDSTPPSERELRDVIAEVCALHVEILLPIPEFADIMNHVPGVAMDVLTMVQKTRVTQDSEDVHKEVEALEELLDSCRLDREQVEEQHTKEAKLAHEQTHLLYKTIAEVAAEKESIQRNAVEEVEKAKKDCKESEKALQKFMNLERLEHEEEAARLKKQIKTLQAEKQRA